MTEWKETQPYATLKVIKGVTGMYVGQVQEIPGIIVQAETKDKLIHEARVSLKVYSEEFREKYLKTFNRGQAIEYERVPITLTAS
jgi:predicted RNase H-like HicB family nuclease